MCVTEKFLFSFLKSISQSNFRVRREVGVSYNHLVQLVSEEIGALSTPVTVVNGEKGTPRPEVKLLELWLNDIQNNRDSVLIVVSNHTLVSVGCVRGHHPVLFARKFSWVIGFFEFLNLGVLHGYVLVPLAYSHLHASVLHNCRLVVFIII